MARPTSAKGAKRFWLGKGINERAIFKNPAKIPERRLGVKNRQLHNQAR